MLIVHFLLKAALMVAGIGDSLLIDAGISSSISVKV